MLSLFHRSAFGVIVALALIVGIFVKPTGQAPSHALVAHNLIAHAATGDHGEEHEHSHDDGESHERRDAHAPDHAPGHTHGHNPADHTHETASALPDRAEPGQLFVHSWDERLIALSAREMSFPLERPPRSPFAG